MYAKIHRAFFDVGREYQLVDWINSNTARVKINKRYFILRIWRDNTIYNANSVENPTPEDLLAMFKKTGEAELLECLALSTEEKIKINRAFYENFIKYIRHNRHLKNRIKKAEDGSVQMTFIKELF